MNRYSTHLDIAALMAPNIETSDERLFKPSTLKQAVFVLGFSILGGSIGLLLLIGGMHVASFINYIL